MWMIPLLFLKNDFPKTLCSFHKNVVGSTRSLEARAGQTDTITLHVSTSCCIKYLFAVSLFILIISKVKSKTFLVKTFVNEWRNLKKVSFLLTNFNNYNILTLFDYFSGLCVDISINKRSFLISCPSTDTHTHTHLAYVSKDVFCSFALTEFMFLSSNKPLNHKPVETDQSDQCDQYSRGWFNQVQLGKLSSLHLFRFTSDILTYNLVKLW